MVEMLFYMNVICRTLTSRLWKKQLVTMVDLLLGQQLSGEHFRFLITFPASVAEAKRILVTAVCVSVPCHIPTLLHGPGCRLGNGKGFTLVVHYWVDLQ